MLSDVWMEVHVVEKDVNHEGVRLDFIIESLRNFCNLTYLVSSAFNEPDREFGNSRVLKKNFLDQYELKCEALMGGSLTVPVVIQPKQGLSTLFDDLEEFKAYFDKTVATATSADLNRVLEHFPVSQNAQSVLNAVNSLGSTEECTLELVKASPERSTIFSSERDQTNIDWLLKQLNTRHPKPPSSTRELTLIAGIKTVDFEKCKFEATTDNGIKIKSDLRQDVASNDLLFKAPNIELDGVYSVDEEGVVLALVEEKEKRLIDTSAITITNLLAGNQNLKANPPLEFRVEFDEAACCYTLEGDFEIFLYAYSRTELESMLNELLVFFWQDYAVEDDSNLAPSGMQLKQELLNRFEQE